MRQEVVMVGSHLRVLLDIVARHGEAKHMLHAEGMTGPVGHGRCVVPSGVQVVWLIGE